MSNVKFENMTYSELCDLEAHCGCTGIVEELDAEILYREENDPEVIAQIDEMVSEHEERKQSDFEYRYNQMLSKVH